MQFSVSTLTSARATPVGPTGEEGGGITLSDLGCQLDRIEGNMQYQLAYTTARHDEAKQNAPRLHQKLKVPYKNLTYPKREDYPGYEDSIEKAAAAEEEEEEVGDDDKDSDSNGGGDSNRSKGGDAGAGSSSNAKGKQQQQQESEEKEMSRKCH